MSIRKLTDDLNIISSLSNRPTENSEELKAKFDEAGRIIKKYLNEVLTADTEAEIEDRVQTATNLINQTITDLETSVQDSISTLNTEITQTMEELKEEIKATTLSYTGFEVTSNSVSYNLSAGKSISSTQTTIKEGYYPLGIVGHSNSNISCDIRRSYLSSSSAGTAVMTYFIQNEDYGNSRSGTYTYYILWVKVS